MNNRLRLAFAAVVLCGFIPGNAAYAALDEKAADISGDTWESRRPAEQVRAVTFDADGHVDVPRDNNGHIRIGTTFGRHGRLSLGNSRGEQACASGGVQSRFKEVTIEAVANAR